MYSTLRTGFYTVVRYDTVYRYILYDITAQNKSLYDITAQNKSLYLQYRYMLNKP
jgi:hypothetical protein